MTSPSKTAANQMNGRRGRGPRTSAGKARASRNARRHGLAAFHTNRDPAMLAEVEKMVDAICQGDHDGQLREQARFIAENRLWLSAVRTQKVAVLERLRDPRAYPLAPGRRLARAKARRRLQVRALPHLLVIEGLIEKTMAAGLDPDSEPLPPALKTAWRPPAAPAAFQDGERDGYEIMREGLCDLLPLLRYEKRAWSRLKKAVRGFMAIKIDRLYDSKP
jgi:hypothetical protein